MANRNNNERVTPDANKAIKPNVVANPVDTTIHYQVNPLNQAKRQAALNLLSDLGQGVAAVDTMFKETAGEDAFELYSQTEGKTNREQWAEASKNIKGIAKFNPYIKDEYKKLVAEGLVRDAQTQLASNPNDYTLSDGEYEQFTQDIRKSMYFNFEQLGLAPLHYKESAEQFEASLAKAKEIYVTKNAEYTYKNTLKQLAYSFSSESSAALLNAKSSEDKITAFKDALNAWDARCSTLGIPDSDKAEAFNTGLTNFIINNPDLMDRKTYLEALSNLKINNKPIGELIPDFAQNMSQLITQSKRQSYNDRLLEMENKNLDYKQAMDEAGKVFIDWISNNPDATGMQVEQKAREIEAQYPLGSEGFSFYNQAASLYKTFKTLHEEKADDKAENAIYAAYLDGSLSVSDLKAAVLSGVIKGGTAVSLANAIEADKKNKISTERKQIIASLNILLPQYAADSKNSPVQDKEIRAAYYKQLQDNMLELISPDITPERAREIYDNVCVKMPKRHQNAAKIQKSVQTGRIFLNPDFLNSESVPDGNENDLDALKKMGIIDNPVITSYFSKNRTINGKTKPHRAIDLASRNNQTAVYTPKQSKGMEILYTGKTPSTGCFVVARDVKTGVCIRYIHLKSVNVKEGDVIKGKRVIGNYGSIDENVTGAHLDIRMWLPDSENIYGVRNVNATDFMKRLEG